MTKTRGKRYMGRCHFHGHPGEMTLEQIQQKRCGAKGCFYFEEYLELSPRSQRNKKTQRSLRLQKFKKEKWKHGDN